MLISFTHLLAMVRWQPLMSAGTLLVSAKNELLHVFFRDDSLATTKGEPIAMWLVRYNEQLGKLNRVGLDIFTFLPDVAGWQALNLADLTENRIERVVSRLPDDTFPLDAISFASVHMSEHVSSSTPAIPPGRAWSSNQCFVRTVGHF